VSLVNIKTSDSTVTASTRHPFWEVASTRWAPAESLIAGSQLLDFHLNASTVQEVRVDILREPVCTYNISVEGANNFFVTSLGILVHNNDTPLDAPGYSNYTLQDANGKTYYSGLFGPNQTQADVEYRHANNNNRYNPANGDTMEVMPGTRTYGEARTLEHETAVDTDTYVGRDGNNYRGNRQYPLSDRNYSKYYPEDAC
jgi:hypothetical protein